MSHLFSSPSLLLRSTSIDLGFKVIFFILGASLRRLMLTRKIPLPAQGGLSLCSCWIISLWPRSPVFLSVQNVFVAALMTGPIYHNSIIAFCLFPSSRIWELKSWNLYLPSLERTRTSAVRLQAFSKNEIWFKVKEEVKRQPEEY